LYNASKLNSGIDATLLGDVSEPMPIRAIRELAAGYTSEIDGVDEQTWCHLLQEFDDANLYQTWSYASVLSGRRSMSHLILRRNGDVAAIAQARITRLPFINLGIAYIQWGPLWRRGNREADTETFRQSIRALRNEFVCKRGFSLRLFPLVFDNEPLSCSSVLAEEGFSASLNEKRRRTILMNLLPSLANLREGMGGNFRRNLKIAERNGLEIVEGSSDELFETFIDIYKEMVSRKKFEEPNDIDEFRLIQTRLPDRLKMRIMLCRSGDRVCAGLVCSPIGDTAIYLFGATSKVGLTVSGSYLLQWKLIENLKHESIEKYNLNGINPDKNPGTFKFKSDLAGKNGKDVYYAGRFDSHPGFISRSCTEFGATLRTAYRKLKQSAKRGRDAKATVKVTNDESTARSVDHRPKTSPALQAVKTSARVGGARSSAEWAQPLGD
jgi:lipid II:glycine glycyltransferase (peptidoglycan interpeptide bridge formation enzyme)